MLTLLPHVSVKWRDQKTCDDKHMIYKKEWIGRLWVFLGGKINVEFIV